MSCRGYVYPVVKLITKVLYLFTFMFASQGTKYSTAQNNGLHSSLYLILYVSDVFTYVNLPTKLFSDIYLHFLNVNRIKMRRTYLSDVPRCYLQQDLHA